MRARANKEHRTISLVFIITLLVGLNIVVFLPAHRIFKLILLGIVTGIAIASRLRWNDVSGFITFLIVNFTWMLVMFYFVSFDWLVAVELLLDFAVSSFTLAIATFAFWKAIPARELVTTLISIKVPRAFAMAASIGTLFLPMIAKSIREIKLSQQARGVTFSILKLPSLVIPAILRILDLSVDMSLSMQSRGFAI